ncbi:PREDICTED: bifunctional dethiobiotin synthetase/7,8-diamino-pelargonic acid aminotransferase, mitochondrial isoform X1 [Lupinus angustifolius]|uniref:bifunctional dethiobiotin synthetase/7,8-diamino-pelargonic acid aminotransferase, mitochondrial isoform X1 n=1 Tax=Lupinus angustifolius TaxID=3871 RepID=UPI00092EF53D|nr:PREDICTED: bifunctional dethiobiotin synthetase/7,8-diamino-pelargonic acid aminotransferase, mitochondrial isoform X1 [Lupinus angustifolius]
MFRFSSLFLSRRHNHLRRHSLRHLSSLTSQPLELPLSFPTYFIWGSNTGVGKTLVSAGIAASTLLSPHSQFHYLKPVQTGFPSDSDSRFVIDKVAQLLFLRNPHTPLFASHSVLNVSPAVTERSIENHEIGEQGFGASKLICKTLYAWEEAVSPHLAAEREGLEVKDSTVLETLHSCFRDVVGSGADKERSEIMCVVETAGGVASPGPSGSLQCDLYRPFRVPAILVGDGRLGGISGTISAYESLTLRGYDVVAVVLEDHGLLNEGPLMSYTRNKVPVLVLPPVPKDPSNDLMEWFEGCHSLFSNLKEIMHSAYFERIKKLHEMPKKARDIIWWPFTQHKLVPDGGVTVIDSRCGENFAVFKAQDAEVIAPVFDACASWWTQGPDAVLQTELAREMGYAAARYGHVMFPENVHEPALNCAEVMLEGVGKGWASRVYFSDNGSTAIEIALKMAFRKFSVDHGLIPNSHEDTTDGSSTDLLVLALLRSYHGDTLGAMEAQAPSAYTGFLQQPWYTGRGLFLDPPSVFMRNNKWMLSLPQGFHFGNLKLDSITFASHEEIFHKGRDKSKLAAVYSSYISKQLSGFKGSANIGALIMEPVIQGSGGMHMVDPLFQRVLVNECRSRKIPVIFDEVFTGFWRLGVETVVELIHCVPDIACFGKLMTGGIIPLAATLATNAVFDSFIGDSKLKALLHGHSYSAHPMGCMAAAKSIPWFKDPCSNPNITSEGRFLRELWDDKIVRQLSSHPAVQRVVALGTLCALELKAEGSNAGYGSLYARSLLQHLREDGVYMRPIGNVIYLLCGPCTSPEICHQLLLKLYKRLEDFDGIKN